MSTQKDEDAHLAARLNELAERSVDNGSVEYSRFLDPREQKAALAAAKRMGAHAAFSGGDAAERRLCAFDGRLWLDESDRRYAWPAIPLEIRWDSRYETLAHRDILGALLALGIGRESIGDIDISSGRAAVWAMEAVVPFLRSNLVSAGRAAVSVEIFSGEAEEAPQAVTRHVRGSVQSLRLDAVVAKAFGLSRQDAARALKSGLVKLDHAEETKADRKVAEGALLSMRGMGRARLVKASEHTKRSGRIIVEFESTV